MFRRRRLVAALVAAVAVAAVLLVAGGTRSTLSSGWGAAGRAATESGRHAGPGRGNAAVHPAATAGELRRVRPSSHPDLLLLLPAGAALALACWSIGLLRRVVAPLLPAGSCRSRAPPLPA